MAKTRFSNIFTKQGGAFRPKAAPKADIKPVIAPQVDARSAPVTRPTPPAPREAERATSGAGTAIDRFVASRPISSTTEPAPAAEAPATHVGPSPGRTLFGAGMTLGQTQAAASLETAEPEFAAPASDGGPGRTLWQGGTTLGESVRQNAMQGQPEVTKPDLGLSHEGEVVETIDSGAVEASVESAPDTSGPTPPAASNAVAEASQPQAPVAPLAEARPEADARPIAPAEWASDRSIMQQPLSPVRRVQADAGKHGIGVARPGSAGSEVMTGDNDVKLHEASFSAQRLLDMYREPTSALREMMGDESLMDMDDSAAIQFIIKYFAENDVQGLCMKFPIVNEADAHRRIIRAHDGPGVRVHPVVHTMWNADFDGDAMTVSFDKSAMAGTKSAIAFLVGTDRDGKVDPDYFSMTRWNYKNKSTKQILREMYEANGVMRRYRLTELELEKLAEAVEEAATGDVGVGYRSMLRWAAEVARRQGHLDNVGQDRAAEEIIDSIWKKNLTMRHVEQAVTEIAGYAGPILAQAVEGSESLMNQFAHLTSDGQMPSSGQAMSRAMSGPIGFVLGDNPIFRFFSSLIKQSKADPAFDSVRSDPAIVTADSLHTSRYVSSIVMEDGTRSLARSVQNRILIEVGKPDASSPAAFRSWLERFVAVHNLMADSVNAAIQNYGLDGTVISHEAMEVMQHIALDGRETLPQSVRTSFSQVYGEFTMRALFGENAPKGWEDTPLSDFIQHNRLSEAEMWLSTTELNGDNAVDVFIGRLADLRTSFARTYNNGLVGDGRSGLLWDFMQKSGHGTRLTELLKQRAEAKSEGIKHAIDQDILTITEALVLIDPEMFYFLGLHSPLRFFSTKLGRRFVEAKTVDELGGALYEAIARYRFEPIRLAEQALLKAAQAGDAEGVKNAEERVEYELMELASSSDVWNMIAIAYRNGLDPFETTLFAGKTKSEMDRELAGWVRGSGIRKVFKHWEVAYGLQAIPKGEYASSRFTGNKGHTELMGNLRSSRSKVQKLAKMTWSDSVAQVKKARSAFGKPGRLGQFLAAVANDQMVLAQMDRHAFVDAALDMDKSFASSEKARQEESASYAYQMVCYLLNGGTYADISVGGDILLGAISIDQFQSSPLFVAKVLSDPDFSIRVYSGNGVIELNREAIFQKEHPSEAEIWNWLEQHPRAAMALRSHSVRNSIINKTGFSYNIATSNLLHSMKHVLSDRSDPESESLRAMHLLADNPGFYAILTLMTRMTGRKRVQVRAEMVSKIDRVVDLIAAMGDYTGRELEFVHDVMVANGMSAERVQAIQDAYEQGMALEEAGVKITDADLTDVRFGEDFQTGQVVNSLASGLAKYHLVLAQNGIKKRAAFTPESAAELLNLNDGETIRGYFDAMQKMSAAKTAQSTSVNGAMSKTLAGVMALSHHKPEPCDAPDPDPTPISEILDKWYMPEFLGKNVRMGNGKWLAIGETTVHRIQDQARPMEVNGQMVPSVLVENPAMCRDSLCACARHASEDPSTNFRKNQSPALGRFLTIVRSLSTEKLNLKTKKIGFDESDSIVKFRVMDILGSGTQEQVDMAYQLELAREREDATYADLEAMAAARLKLAQLMKQQFTDMGYEEELSLDDFINVAQVLVRRKADGSGVFAMPLGQVSAIINATMQRVDHKIDFDQLVEMSADAINSYSDESTLDVETVMAGVRLASNMPVRHGLLDKAASNTERQFEMAKKIRARFPDLRSMDDWELDTWELSLWSSSEEEFGTWSDVAGPDRALSNDEILRGRGKRRFRPRIIGVVAGSKDSRINAGIGPNNAWIISTTSPHFGKAMALAYERGLTILLEGEPTPAQWNEVRELTDNQLDANQGIEPPQVGTPRTIINTMDIHLNGQNTMWRDGYFDAGVWHALPEKISFFAESVANEHNLSDSEAGITESWAARQVARMEDTYSVKASTAFAGFFSDIAYARAEGMSHTPQVSVVTPDEALGWLRSEDFDPLGQIDLGVPVKNGDTRHTRLMEGIERYLRRADEIDPLTGMLPDAKPDEIIGWLRADYGDAYQYHPIRPFESDNKSSAPAEFTIEDVFFNEDTQSVVVRWKQEVSMLGRLFKFFEDLYAANKFMARARNIPDIVLESGYKLAGMVAQASTVKRRLFNRPAQLMTTLMYMARMEPFGYNLAADGNALLGEANESLRLGLLNGTASIGDWVTALNQKDAEGNTADLVIFGDDPDLNAFANRMAREAIKYNINPTVVFASRYERDGRMVASNLWFNFQLLFEPNPVYHKYLMRFLSRMMPTLCPGNPNQTEGHLFNDNLQLKIPVTLRGHDGHPYTVKQWVNVYGGFNFMDEHYTGRSASGSTVKTFGAPTMNTLLPGRKLSPSEVWAYMQWANMGAIDPDATGPKFRIASESDLDEDPDPDFYQE